MLTDEEIDAIGSERAPYTDFQFARAIESAACSERDARIAELEQQLAEARKDAELLDWLDKQNADIENDAWLVLAHDCTGDEDCKKYWVGADLRGAIRAAIKEQT